MFANENILKDGYILMLLHLQWKISFKKTHCAPLKSMCGILNCAGNITCYFCPLYKTHAEI